MKTTFEKLSYKTTYRIQINRPNNTKFRSPTTDGATGKVPK